MTSDNLSQQYVKPQRQKNDLFLVYLHDYNVYLNEKVPEGSGDLEQICRNLRDEVQSYKSALLSLFKSFDTKSLKDAVETFGYYTQTKISSNGSVLMWLFNTHSLCPYYLKSETVGVVPFNISKLRYLQLEREFLKYDSRTNDIRAINYSEF